MIPQVGIYSIRNKLNNKIYIGSSRNIDQRWYNHKFLLRKGKHHSWRLQKDWNQYGEENFEFLILEEVADISTILDIEQRYLDKIQSWRRSVGYNILSETRVSLTTQQIFNPCDSNRHKRRLVLAREKAISNQENSNQIHINISDELEKLLEELASDSGQSLSDVAADCIKLGILDFIEIRYSMEVYREMRNERHQQKSDDVKAKRIAPSLAAGEFVDRAKLP